MGAGIVSAESDSCDFSVTVEGVPDPGTTNLDLKIGQYVMDVQPVMARGAVFSFTIPVADPIESTPPTPTTPAAPPKPPGPRVVIECDGDTYTVVNLGSPEKQIRKAWKHKYDECSAKRTTGAPLTKIEKKALKKARYSTDEATSLYEFCAVNDKSDYYAQKSSTPSSSQRHEVQGWLTFCPHHPLAGKWKRFLDPTADHSVSKFEDGNYRVGKEIKPGRYYAKDGDDCYWERNNKSGDIILNHLSGARRNEVTIYASDYEFSSERCGTWRRS